VKNGEHLNPLLGHAIVNRVRKARQEGPSVRRRDEGPGLGLLAHEGEQRIDLFKKRFAEPWALRFVPAEGLVEIV
jgi:hypothetical protein